MTTPEEGVPSEQEVEHAPERPANSASYEVLLKTLKDSHEQPDVGDGTVYEWVNASEGYGWVAVHDYVDGFAHRDFEPSRAVDSKTEILETGKPILSIRGERGGKPYEVVLIPKDSYLVDPVGLGGMFKEGMANAKSGDIVAFDQSANVIPNLDEDLYYSGLIDALASHNP
jgi:hypothetical protein